MQIGNFAIRTALCALLLIWPIRLFALSEVTVIVTGGETDALTDDVLNASVLQKLKTEAAVEPGDIVAAAKADYARVLDVLYAQAYYGASVSITIDGREAAELDPFLRLSKADKALIRVDPGPRFQFGNLRLAPLPPGVSLPEGFAAGNTARAPSVRRAVQRSLEAWRNAGYPKARLKDQVVTARHSDALLDVKIELDPGPRAVFGDAVPRGPSDVRPDRLRAIADIPKGETFDPEKVADATRRLRQTGAFRSARIVEGEVDRNGAMPMFIEVVDRTPRRIGAGIEASSFDGVSLSGFWLHRNLLGGAERLRIEGKVENLGGSGSDPDYSFSLRFERPAVPNADTLFFSEALLARTELPDISEDQATLSFGLSRRFSETLSGELGIGFSALRVQDDTALLFSPPSAVERDLRLILLPGSLTWDRRDSDVDATTGTYLKADLTPFYEFEAGYAGLRLQVDARGYRALGAEGRTVLAGRLQLGSLIGPDVREAPPGFLFYSGGGGTVRGQPFESLGADFQGVKLGGRSFASMSVEMRYAVTDTIGLVGFVDAGFVGPDSDFSGGDIHAGAGLGLRYKTPVGPIRLDVGAPLTSDTSDGIQLYIGIGQAF